MATGKIDVLDEDELPNIHVICKSVQLANKRNKIYEVAWLCVDCTIVIQINVDVGGETSVKIFRLRMTSSQFKLKRFHFIPWHVRGVCVAVYVRWSRSTCESYVVRVLSASTSITQFNRKFIAKCEINANIVSCHWRWYGVSVALHFSYSLSSTTTMRCDARSPETFAHIVHTRNSYLKPKIMLSFPLNPLWDYGMFEAEVAAAEMECVLEHTKIRLNLINCLTSLILLLSRSNGFSVYASHPHALLDVRRRERRKEKVVQRLTTFAVCGWHLFTSNASQRLNPKPEPTTAKSANDRKSQIK